MRKGRQHLEASLPRILEDTGDKLSGALRVLLTQLNCEMQYLHRQIKESDKLILRIADELEACRRLVAIPGIGPLIATATIAAIGNRATFRKGRRFAAWLGVVPGEHSTGGKFHPGSAFGAATANQTNFRSSVAGQSRITQAQAGGDSGTSQQDGTHGLALLTRGEAYRPPALLRKPLQPDGLQMWKSLKRFPHLQPNDDGSEFLLSGLLANHEMVQRSIPALPKPVLGKCLQRQSS